MYVYVCMYVYMYVCIYITCITSARSHPRSQRAPAARSRITRKTSSPAVATSIGDASCRVSTAEPATGTPAARFNIRWMVTSSRLANKMRMGESYTAQ